MIRETLREVAGGGIGRVSRGRLFSGSSNAISNHLKYFASPSSLSFVAHMVLITGHGNILRNL